ncbi:threonine/serine ThrE exporter family protein [Anaerocolumna sp. MB42-C2]|uniref:threonine/serine ThrE exporter family protein n=1 Tax=Anaerocolumna sp. MB42-C2 TaxID=3070997 RepID=UPI0027E1C24E|nr:threonine/serine exporter family protein [Anaerocolumna sp. MB42-C2]WMJ86058.1 threonine/serine exporter family protein [Anaerocolumna sp. MB42-C2]
MDTDDNKYDKEFQVIVLAGELLLSNGAEIFRVEDTMDRIAKAFDLADMDTFIIANGIFVTAKGNESKHQFKIKHIPTGATNLEKIELVNQISRLIEQKIYDVDEALYQLQELKKKRRYSEKTQIAAYGLGSSSFCYFLGGSVKDSFVSLFLGIVLGLTMSLFAKSSVTKAIQNIMGSAIVTILAIMAYHTGFGDNIDKMIIGAIIPLVPGVAFTNAVRDFIENDYISGIVRMLDSVLVAFSIAIGVGVVWSIMR